MPRYLCLIYTDAAANNAQPRASHLKRDDENRAFHRSLGASGHLVDSAALAAVREAVTIRPRDGGPAVTDGPFAETKEHLGGYFIIDARDRDEAVDIMRRDPKLQHASIEIREAMSIMDDDWRDWADRTHQRE